MSVMMLAVRTATAMIRTIPIISDGSRCEAARTASWPMPGHEKTCSVTIAPATSSGSSRPTTVMIGISAFRRPWRTRTIRPRSPLDLAVVTYSLDSTSSMLGARVAHERRGVAKPRISAGMSMCARDPGA